MTAVRLSIPDAIDRAGRLLQERYGDRPIPRADIVREVLRLGNYSPSSIMPSDFCYNRTDKDARPIRYCVFLSVPGGYQYVGRKYSTTRTTTSLPSQFRSKLDDVEKKRTVVTCH